MLEEIAQLVEFHLSTFSFLPQVLLIILLFFFSIPTASQPTTLTLFSLLVALITQILQFKRSIYQISIKANYNISILFSMYIEPAQYLDISDRVAILSKKCRGLQSQNINLKGTICTQVERIRMLELQVSELEKWKQTQKEGIKEHIITNTHHILAAIQNAKEKQKTIINEKVDKVRNWSAINTLKKLEERINENRTVTFEKDFFEKVKILYIIDKKKTSCNSTELFNWIKELLTIKNNDPLATANNLNEIAQVTHNGPNISLLVGTQKNLNGIPEHSQVKPIQIKPTQEFQKPQTMQQSLLSMRQQIKT